MLHRRYIDKIAKVSGNGKNRLIFTLKNDDNI